MGKKNQTYSGKSIAEQLLDNTWVGRLLYGKSETYKDGYDTDRKDTSFKESANGQLVQRMGETAKDVGQLTAETLFDTASDVYYTTKATINGNWKDVGLNLAFIALPLVGHKTVSGISDFYRRLNMDPLYTRKANVSREIAFEELDNLGLDVENLYNKRRVRPTPASSDPSPDEIMHYLHQAKLAEEGIRNHRDISDFLDYRRRFMEKYPDFVNNLEQGGTIKAQPGTKLLTPHKDYLGTPYKQDGDYNYFEAHPENMPTKPEEHWTSRNPVTGHLLKSEMHPTFNLLLNGEQEAGMQIYCGLNGELYSYPKEQQVPLYLKKYNYGNR